MRVMMLIIRCILVIIAVLAGSFICWEQFESQSSALAGAGAGLLAAILILLIEQRIKKLPLKAIVGGGVGLLIGLIIANLFSYVLLVYYEERSLSYLVSYLLFNCVAGFLGLGIGLRKGEEFTSAKTANLKGPSEKINFA